MTPGGGLRRPRDGARNRPLTTNLERAFADRPDVYAAWRQLITAIKSGMDVRRYELATLAAARWLHSSYSCLAHGAVLLELDEPVCEIALDHRTAGLDDVDVAVMDLARTLDALEARPDASYGELAPELRELLIIGRPIAGPYPGRDRARLALDRSEA